MLSWQKPTIPSSLTNIQDKALQKEATRIFKSSPLFPLHLSLFLFLFEFISAFNLLPLSLFSPLPLSPTSPSLSPPSSSLTPDILGWSGDKKLQYPAQLAKDILEKGVRLPAIRNEIFLQIVKQLNNNKGEVHLLTCFTLHSLSPLPFSLSLSSLLLSFSRKGVTNKAMATNEPLSLSLSPRS